MLIYEIFEPVDRPVDDDVQAVVDGRVFGNLFRRELLIGGHCCVLGVRADEKEESGARISSGVRVGERLF